jgi:hypothetical protein
VLPSSPAGACRRPSPNTSRRTRPDRHRPLRCPADAGPGLAAAIDPAQRHIPARPNMTGEPPHAGGKPDTACHLRWATPIRPSFPRRPGPAAVTAMNAGPHGAGRFALLTLARLGTAAGAPGSAAWAAAPHHRPALRMTNQSGEHYPQRTRIGDQAVTLPRSADPIDADQSGRACLAAKYQTDSTQITICALRLRITKKPPTAHGGGSSRVL